MPPPKYREARRRATAGAFGAGHTGDPCECGEQNPQVAVMVMLIIIACLREIRMESRTHCEPDYAVQAIHLMGQAELRTRMRRVWRSRRQRRTLGVILLLLSSQMPVFRLQFVTWGMGNTPHIRAGAEPGSGFSHEPCMHDFGGQTASALHNHGAKVLYVTFTTWGGNGVRLGEAKNPGPNPDAGDKPVGAPPTWSGKGERMVEATNPAAQHGGALKQPGNTLHKWLTPRSVQHMAQHHPWQGWALAKGYRVIPVPGDGHCLYHALSHGGPWAEQEQRSLRMALSRACSSA